MKALKIVGYLLVTVGFLAGALFAVLEADRVLWPHFIGVFVVGCAGVAMIRTAERTGGRAETRVAAGLQQAESSLARVKENIARLNETKDSLDVYDVRHRLDELFVADLSLFVEARTSISHAYGLQAYADVMSHFASAERYLNRVWSASADGYVDEVNEYLEKATSQFTEALQMLRKLSANSRAPS